jgi:hypothetical protein
MRKIVLLFVVLVYSVGFSQEEKKKPSTAMKVPLPPVVAGGLTSLWYHDHKFLLDEYGEFELLNYKNAGFKSSRDSITAYSWEPFVLGDFVEKEVSYATIARIKNSDKGLLLLFFRWIEPSDSTQTNGIFYRTFIAKDKLLLRTKQCTTGGVDTLEISCGDLKERCGKCYFDNKKAEMVLEMVSKEE